MKRLLAMAAFLLASSAAQAQYQFEYGGRTIRIDPDRGTISIPGVYDNTGRKSRRAKSDAKSDAKPDAKSDTAKSDQDAPNGKQDAKVEPQAAPAAAETAVAPPAPAPPPAAAPTATVNNAPADTAVSPPPAPLPPVQQAAPQPPAPSPPAATVATAPPRASAPAPAQITPDVAQRTRDTNSPVGVWLTEEKEGKVRIEPCGNNLCGYSVDAKSNANGEQVLINMRPGKDQKWSGRILDPNSGSTYDSTLAMKGPDTLHVQGCAFGGMFCGGQTWTRVN